MRPVTHATDPQGGEYRLVSSWVHPIFKNLYRDNESFQSVVNELQIVEQALFDMVPGTELHKRLIRRVGVLLDEITSALVMLTNRTTARSRRERTAEVEISQ